MIQIRFLAGFMGFLFMMSFCSWTMEGSEDTTSDEIEVPKNTLAQVPSNLLGRFRSFPYFQGGLTLLEFSDKQLPNKRRQFVAQVSLPLDKGQGILHGQYEEITQDGQPHIALHFFACGEKHLVVFGLALLKEGSKEWLVLSRDGKEFAKLERFPKAIPHYFFNKIKSEFQGQEENRVDRKNMWDPGYYLVSGNFSQPNSRFYCLSYSASTPETRRSWHAQISMLPADQIDGIYEYAAETGGKLLAKFQQKMASVKQFKESSAVFVLDNIVGTYHFDMRRNDKPYIASISLHADGSFSGRRNEYQRDAEKPAVLRKFTKKLEGSFTIQNDKIDLTIEKIAGESLSCPETLVGRFQNQLKILKLTRAKDDTYEAALLRAEKDEILDEMNNLQENTRSLGAKIRKYKETD